MNTLVNFETAKLLKEKGFDIRVKPFYNGLKNNELIISDIIGTDNNLPDWYPAPTIAEVVMWLYDKHEIWIIGVFTKSDTNLGKYKGLLELNTPTEAYETAIIYTLKNLI